MSDRITPPTFPPTANVPGLEIESVCRTALTSEWQGVRYRDDRTRLYYIESGLACLRLTGDWHELPAGSFALLPAGTTFDFRSPAGHMQHYIHLRLLPPGGALFFTRQTATNFLAACDAPALPGLFGIAHELSASPAPSGRCALCGIVWQILAAFLTTASPSPTQSPTTLRLAPVLDYICAHPGADLSTPTLAALVHLERSYFTRLFTCLTGQPPARYVRLKRLAEAACRLRETTAPVGQIAADLGFCDAFHLSREFRRQFGLCPTAYRTRPLVRP